MIFCTRCGTQLNDGDLFCPKCGAKQEQNSGFTTQQNTQQNAQSQDFYSSYNTYTAPPANDDSGHIAWGLLGFFFPIVGLILFLIWKDERPKTSKIAGKGALISVIVSTVLGIIAFIAYAVLAVAMFSTW